MAEHRPCKARTAGSIPLLGTALFAATLALCGPAAAQYVPAWVFPKAGIDCDFANQRYYNCPLDTNLSITRTSIGLAQDAQSGIWYSYDNGVPRISSRGWLIEEGSTNNALWARDLTQSGTWTATNITTAKNATGIDGTANSATTLTAGAANGTILQAITLASATQVYGVHVKRVTGSGNIQATLDNSTYTTLTSTQCVDQTGAAASINATNFVWCSISQAALTNPTIGIKIVTSGDVIVVDGNQEENLGVTYPTSPIFTTIAPQARGTDNVTAIALLARLIGGAQGTIYIEAGGTLNSANSPRFVVRSATNYLRVLNTTQVSPVVNNAGLTITLGASGSTTGLTKHVFAWGGSASATQTGGAANGGTTVTSANLYGGGAGTSYQIGSVSGTSNFYDGYFRRIAVSPVDANLSSISGLSQ